MARMKFGEFAEFTEVNKWLGGEASEPKPEDLFAELYKGGKAEAIAAVKKDGSVLKYVGHKLLNDFDVVLAAVSENGGALEYAGEEIRKNRVIVEVAVRNRGSVLQYAYDGLKDDKDIVLLAVKSSWSALAFASERLRGDKEVVLDAVRRSGRALEFASMGLRSNEEIVRVAIGSNNRAFEFVGDELLKNKNFCMHILRRVNAYFLERVSEELKNDKEVVLAAVLNNEAVISHASVEIQNLCYQGFSEKLGAAGVLSSLIHMERASVQKGCIDDLVGGSNSVVCKKVKIKL